MKFRWRILFFALGIGGIVLMAWQNDWFRGTDWGTLFNPGIAWLLASIFAVWIVIYFLHAFSYKLILCEDSKKVKMHSMMRICAAGFALNNVTPAGLVGGEPYRIMALKRYVSVERAASSTLTFSIMYAVGHFLLWVTGVILFAIYHAFGHSAPLWVSLILGISGGVLFLLVLGFFIFKKMGFAYPAMRLLAKIPLLRKKLAPYVEKHKDSYIEIDDNIRAFRNKTWRFTAVLLLQYSTRLLEALEYFLILFYVCLSLNIHVNYFDGLLIMSTASLMGNLLFIIPMQAGSRELGTQMALSFVLGPEATQLGILAPVGLIYRFRELTFIIIGIILVLTGRKYKKDQIKEFVDRSLKDQIELANELEKEKNQ